MIGSIQIRIELVNPLTFYSEQENFSHTLDIKFHKWVIFIFLVYLQGKGKDYSFTKPEISPNKHMYYYLGCS